MSGLDRDQTAESMAEHEDRPYAQNATRGEEHHAEPAERIAVEYPEADAVGVSGKIAVEQAEHREGRENPAVAAILALTAPDAALGEERRGREREGDERERHELRAGEEGVEFHRRRKRRGRDRRACPRSRNPPSRARPSSQSPVLPSAAAGPRHHQHLCMWAEPRGKRSTLAVDENLQADCLARCGEVTPFLSRPYLPENPKLLSFAASLYPAHTIIRNFFGSITRKLSVTSSQYVGQFLGTSLRRKFSIAMLKSLNVA